MERIGRVTREKISIEDYCSRNMTQETRNWYVTHFTGRTVDEVESNPRESVELALKVITDKYDLIGFQDAIPTFMSELIARARLYLPFKNDCKNKTSDRISTADLSVATRRVITDINSLDIMLFDRLANLRVDGVIRNPARN